jgi:tRNA A-37 threonylcarbamoyl transferase component Bud32
MPESTNPSPASPPSPSGLLEIGLAGESQFPTAESGPVRDRPAAPTPHRALRFVPPNPAELSRWLPQLEVLELIGQGGMGAVYKARQRTLDRVVALKVLPPEGLPGVDPAAFAERFAREAKALAKLNHPGIVAVYDFGQTPARESLPALCWFVMEYVEGTNLRDAIRHKTLSPQAALAVVPQICDALQYAHDQGVVHRDIKPENLLVDTRGRVKIADFGLAKLIAQPSADETQEMELTMTHQVVGTPKYMAPEQLEGAQPIDHRADIYSLGVVFYEMLTGELPIGRFAPPSKKVHIDVRLDEVVLRTLEKEPSLRFQNVSEIKTEMEAISAQGPRALFAGGREYKSKTTLFGWPLLHICSGPDPFTGKRRVAKGIVAIGDIAVGGVAIGGSAFGVLAIGGLGVGLFTFAGCALGILAAIGGVAVGSFAWGGLGIGFVAMGGMSVGVWAAGGSALGVFKADPTRVDPQAEVVFAPFANWYIWLAWMGALSPVLFAAVYLFCWSMFRRQAKQEAAAKSVSSSAGPIAAGSR